MSESKSNDLSRRDVLKKSGDAAVAAGVFGAATHLLSDISIPKVHAAQDSTIRVALVGCGGRGTGAAINALSVKNGPIKLVAMADVFPDKLNAAHKNLKSKVEKDKLPGEFDVPEDKKFIGFDAYKQALDCLRPNDVAIFATPPAFRWVHFGAAIDKGINVFMEKPVTVDGPSSRKLLTLAEASTKKNLKVGVGLMCRHCDARQQLHDRIKAGEIGDVLLMRAYRQAGPTGSAFCEAMPKNWDKGELLYQIKNFHAFLWASGGAFSDFLIHNIDECCWMKDAWPVKAEASGGRHFRTGYVDQNFDTYSVSYTFADGTKLQLEGRTMPGCKTEFASYAHGQKGTAVISSAGHTPAKCRIYKGQNMTPENLTWSYGPNEPNPYQLEWDHLIQAIRSDKPYNEAKRGVEASLVTSMGRMAAHTGRVITFEEMLNCEHEFGPTVDKLTMNGPAPVLADKDGKYPIPQPGLRTKTEY
ncbi:MAG: Gfo/Idh/MocA family oxidoreductase [Planctomycetia bacterium]|nr:Gfo/Idh/MocA family oxidoreductase [Planctomycetia bacterium]